MRQFHDIDEFALSAEAGWVKGRVFVRWRLDATLRGYMVWGEPNCEDARHLVDVFDAELGRADLHVGASLADYRRMERVDEAAFEVLSGHVAGDRPDDPAQVARFREAIIRPAGLTGAVVTGFFAMIRPDYPCQVFTSQADALAWLGRKDARDALDDLAHMADDSSVPVLVRRLRTQLASGQPPTLLTEASARLGVASRTLQHHLSQAGSSFRSEVHRARMARALRRLEGTDDTISTIAHASGFASSQHFSDWFRRATGCTPSAWRQRTRAGRAKL